MKRNSIPMVRRILLALAFLCSCVAPASANDETGPLEPNARVRLSVTTQDLLRVLSGPPLTPEQISQDRFIGTLQGRRDDDVVIRIRPPGSELAIPIRSVTRIEASQDRHGHAGRGALIGLGSGMLGGVLAGLIVCSGGNCESSGIDGETGIVSIVLGLGGAIVGTGVGAVTGSLIRTERWHTIQFQDLPYGEGLSPENGIRIGLTLPIWNRDLVAGTEGY